MRYHFTESEIKKLAGTFTVLHDTREQQNGHILAWLERAGVAHKKQALKTGDYSIMVPACPDLGLLRDIYFSAAVERKNGVDELIETVKQRARFENELIRGQQLGFFAVVVEDAAGYPRIVKGDYRSLYNSKALQASLAALSIRYSCPIHFIPAEYSPRWIYTFLYYFALEQLQRLPLAMLMGDAEPEILKEVDA